MAPKCLVADVNLKEIIVLNFQLNRVLDYIFWMISGYNTNKDIEFMDGKYNKVGFSQWLRYVHKADYFSVLS